MLYVYFGNDVSQVREKALAFVGTLAHDPTAVVKVTSDTYEVGMLSDFVEATSLFGGEQYFVLDTLSDDTGIFDEVLKNAEALKESHNHFVLIEGTLLVSPKKALTKFAEKMEECLADKKERFNAFSLTDAFLRRDKKSLWLLLNEAWREGLSNEEIIGVLFWQVKILRLAEKTASPEEAGQKPFVYSKAKQALRNFKKGELDVISEKLIEIYHDGHLGKSTTGLALEQWILRL